MRLTGDALTGLATTCCGDLQRHGILSLEAEAAVGNEEQFSEGRGRQLARQLTAEGWSRLLEFCERDTKDRFLLHVLHAAAQGHWSGPEAIASNLPELPSYVTTRQCFEESRHKLQAAVEEDQQKWLVLWGPRAAGKTTAALHLASQVPLGVTPIWFSFGERRSADEIYQSARRVIENCFPKACWSTNPDARLFIKETLSSEATKDFVLFLDDVCDVNLLAPFTRTKTAVVTSPSLVEYHEVDGIVDVCIDLSLTERESVCVTENILKNKLSKIDGHEHIITILNGTHFNALATSVLASHIKSVDKKKWSKGLFKKMQDDTEKNAKEKFKNIGKKLKNKGHRYAEESKYLNIYVIIEFAIQNLSDEDLEDPFKTLIVFPRDTPIVSNVFQKLNDDVDDLEALVERSLLGHSGDDYIIHGLIRDVLEDYLNDDEKRDIFQTLVTQYEEDEVNDDDMFYLLHFISTCLNAHRNDVARRLLTSGEYLLWRFFKTRFTNLFVDFEAVLNESPNDAVNSFLNFFMDSPLWNQGFDKKSLMRQAVLFNRSIHVDNELQRMFENEELALPLFKATNQKEETSCGYKEVARTEVGVRTRNLALNGDGNAIATVEDRENHENVADDFRDKMTGASSIIRDVVSQSNSFQDLFSNMQGSLKTLTEELPERQPTSEDEKVDTDLNDLRFTYNEIFGCLIEGLSDAFLQVLPEEGGDQSEEAIQQQSQKPFIGRRIHPDDLRISSLVDNTLKTLSHLGGRDYSDDGIKGRLVQDAFQDGQLKVCRIPEDGQSESLPAPSQEMSLPDYARFCVGSSVENILGEIGQLRENITSLLSSETELVLFDPQLSERKKLPLKENVLCTAPTYEGRWLMVTQNSCSVIGSDFSEVAQCRIDGDVEMAAIDPCGNFAAL